MMVDLFGTPFFWMYKNEQSSQAHMRRAGKDRALCGVKPETIELCYAWGPQETKKVCKKCHRVLLMRELGE